MGNLITFLPLFFKVFNKSEREYILKVAVKAVDQHKDEDERIDETLIRLVESFCVYATQEIDTAGRIEAMNFNEEELIDFKWELNRAIGERYFGKQMIVEVKST